MKNYIENELDNPKSWYSQAEILFNLGCYEEALAKCNETLTIQPDHYTAWVLRGSALTHLNCYPQALTSFEKALKIQPDDKTALLFKGLALHHLGRYKYAYTTYNQVLGTQKPSIWQKLIQLLQGLVHPSAVKLG
ncbi:MULTISPECIES: tetratricopeptide repeat protein [unclassified Coleofasciculus]|uniref:tetratricopeptide repeat protein n=1 Tax=unclassified Coleofasciculus TaxID=2692782 RepID=UPI0018818174|nr:MULTISPECIES: tetratricopeptide repeat protein [unclassified Coleofasciculus]MBE9124710.1 tetratricopeptide repeat protein [Coleofasciculus sp. LEGE 07081]MBE9147037.1 tetratricopeptide repeat protein [Coleofasciculus sp. LEGE 07092]